MPELFHQEAEAAWSTCVCRPPAPTSAGPLFRLGNLALEGGGHFQGGPECLLRMQNQCGSHVLFQDVQQPSHMSGVELGTPGRRHGHGEGPGPGPFASPRLGPARTDTQLCDFLENHVLGKELKLIKKMGDT
ncbi:ferritin light chain-like [Pteronotus mesoamericanus]|uniref:ferritin light chain-like n=1 Tax=Pteronotus mesoamericanus TaxID=1884717 RepID=UPI0023ECF485|nr:ferritin light chain-like [Pteronotus parnellii mesoamericanus]